MVFFPKAARAVAVLVGLFLLVVPAVAGASPGDPSWAGSEDDPLPRSWAVPGDSTDLVLRDAAGSVVPWASPPVVRDGDTWVTPPLLPPGQYVISGADEELAVSVAGFDYTAVGGSGEGTLLPALALGALAVLLASGAWVLWRRSLRVPGSVVGVLALVCVGGSVVLAVSPLASQAPVVPLDVSANVVAACPEYPWSARSECAGPVLVSALLGGGPSSAMEVVEASAQVAPIDCHDLAHDVGRASWMLLRDPQAIVTVDRPGSCQFGFAHGALEAAAVTESADGLLAVANQVCGGLASRVDAAEFADIGGQCFHGLGHALIRRVAADADVAMGSCGLVDDDVFAQQCRIGVLMEWGRLWLSAQEGGVWLPPGPADPRAPCQEFSGALTQECYFGGASAMLSLVSAQELIAGCDAVPSDHFDDCIEGTLRAFPTRDNDVPRLLSRCSLVPDRFADSCVQLMVRSLAPSHRNDPLGLCREFGEFEQVCRVTVREFFADLASGGDSAVALDPERDPLAS